MLPEELKASPLLKPEQGILDIDPVLKTGFNIKEMVVDHAKAAAYAFLSGQMGRGLETLSPETREKARAVTEFSAVGAGASYIKKLRDEPRNITWDEHLNMALESVGVAGDAAQFAFAGMVLPWQKARQAGTKALEIKDTTPFSAIETITKARKAEGKTLTKYMKLADGKVEISDKGAVLRSAEVLVDSNTGVVGLKSSMRLGDLVQHEELFNLWPELREVAIDFSPRGPKGRRGSYAAADDRFGPATITLHPAKSEKEMLETVLHELQHHVQDMENWPGGGSKEIIAEALFGNKAPDALKLYDDMSVSPELAQVIEKYAPGKDKSEMIQHLMYSMISGEKEAKLTGFRSKMSIEEMIMSGGTERSFYSTSYADPDSYYKLLEETEGLFPDRLLNRDDLLQSLD